MPQVWVCDLSWAASFPGSRTSWGCWVQALAVRPVQEGSRQATGRAEGALEVNQQEQLREARALLDIALVDYDKRVNQDKAITDEMDLRMGQTIQTRGCHVCGSTMYKTVETDENGNPTSESQYICGSCGAMA